MQDRLFADLGVFVEIHKILENLKTEVASQRGGYA
jgi:hypothetical protein